MAGENGIGADRLGRVPELGAKEMTALSSSVRIASWPWRSMSTSETPAEDLERALRTILGASAQVPSAVLA